MLTIVNMTSLLRHTTTKHFLTLMLVVVFLAVSLWQSSHVHHQHGPEKTELASVYQSFVSGFSGSHHDNAEHHGEHSHDTPYQTAHLYKHQPSWKSLRGKTDGDSTLKIPVVICARVISVSPSEIISIPSSHVIEKNGLLTAGRPPARAPPFSVPLS
ncbi:hypothetical protein [Pelovirga terrestris]|uniref:Uncharacterized protein n=1 Tax=Pelovirga terrestris TaxID=2771352 RepID=A0A8J6QX27_9BACT|nr:hypothetical protein [Pelovirga terrestris]MBD1400461.1 hypothetical protein [Pelovirga terrestris]